MCSGADRRLDDRMTPAAEIVQARPRNSKLRKAGSIVARARELGPCGLALIARAFLLLLAAKIALRVLPTRRVIAWKQRAIPGRPPGATEREAQQRRRIRHAILTVARYSPVRFVCFPQCLAASALLRAKGIDSRLHYGVARAPAGGKLITHTWLESGGELVIGGEVAADYSTLAVY